MTKKASDKTNITCDPKRLNAFSLKTSDNAKFYLTSITRKITENKTSE